MKEIADFCLTLPTNLQKQCLKRKSVTVDLLSILAKQCQLRDLITTLDYHTKENLLLEEELYPLLLESFYDALDTLNKTIGREIVESLITKCGCGASTLTD